MSCGRLFLDGVLFSRAHLRFTGTKKSENAAIVARNLRLAAKRLQLNSDLVTVALEGQSPAQANLDDLLST